MPLRICQKLVISGAKKLLCLIAAGDAVNDAVASVGLTQEDYCVVVHRDLGQLDLAVRQGGGQAMAIVDDVYEVGLPHDVFLTVRDFEDNIKEHCGLSLQRSKSKVFTWSASRWLGTWWGGPSSLASW